MTHIDHTTPQLDALYSPLTGRRLAPDDGREPPSGTPVAVLVFDRGVSLPVFGDTVLGRRPFDDRRVTSGSAEPVVVEDPASAVSRCHVYLRVDRWRVEAIDLGSSNGTTASSDGSRWSSLIPGLGHLVRDGQLLRFGSVEATVHLIGR